MRIRNRPDPDYFSGSGFETKVGSQLEHKMKRLQSQNIGNFLHILRNKVKDNENIFIKSNNEFRIRIL